MWCRRMGARHEAHADLQRAMMSQQSLHRRLATLMHDSGAEYQAHSVCPSLPTTIPLLACPGACPCRLAVHSSSPCDQMPDFLSSCTLLQRARVEVPSDLDNWSDLRRKKVVPLTETFRSERAL